MLLITKIEFLDVDGDSHAVVDERQLEPLHPKDIGMTEEKIVRELVRGRRFTRPNDGVEIVIGLSKQAQDIIGLQYEAWEALEKDRDYWHRKCIASRLKIDSIKMAGFWERLKWLVFGYK